MPRVYRKKRKGAEQQQSGVEEGHVVKEDS